MGKSKNKDKDKEREDKSPVKKEKSVAKEESSVECAGDSSITKAEKSFTACAGDKSLSLMDAHNRPEYNELIKYVSVIAKPLASKKLTKRLYKTVKKASKVKTLRRGVKEVVKAIRKGEKGIVVIAGDISPIDVISHIPVMCEDKSLPYAYVPSKLDLGVASMTKRPTSIVMIKHHEDIVDYYQDCFSEVKALPLPI